MLMFFLLSTIQMNVGGRVEWNRIDFVNISLRSMMSTNSKFPNVTLSPNGFYRTTAFWLLNIPPVYFPFTFTTFTIYIYNRCLDARLRYTVYWCLYLCLQIIWFATALEDGVQLSLTSPDGDQGYPGEVHVSVSYTLRVNDTLQQTLRGRCFKIRPLSGRQ